MDCADYRACFALVVILAARACNMNPSSLGGYGLQNFTVSAASPKTISKSPQKVKVFWAFHFRNPAGRAAMPTRRRTTKNVHR
jgi:hypothetical protein